MLDSNVWRHLVDAEAIEELRAQSRKAGVAIIACPAVAFEALRMPSSPIKRKLVKAITRGEWVRPMPEAFDEANAMRFAINNHRPEWLVAYPDLRHWHRLRSDWESGWWRRARAEPAAESARIDLLSGDDLRRAREATHFLRKDAIDAQRSFGTIDVNSVSVLFDGPAPGWDGEPFDGWRADGITTWWRELIERQDSAYLDWLGPWIDLRAIENDVASWNSFWIRDVTKSELPQNWLRWALDYVQRTRRTTPGTPVDNQIGTYLASCDHFVTGDKALVECIEKIRLAAPVPLAKNHVVPAGAEGNAALLGVIQAAGSHVGKG